MKRKEAIRLLRILEKTYTDRLVDVHTYLEYLETRDEVLKAMVP